MDILDRINLKLAYNNRGEDVYGNQYYESKNIDITGKYKRVVKYKGIAEPTKIPPMWHAWVHYLKKEVPNTEETQVEGWLKEHVPNLTGIERYKTVFAPRKKVSSDYEAWNINEKQSDYEQ